MPQEYRQGTGSILEAAHFFIQEYRRRQICPIEFQELVERIFEIHCG